VGSRSFAVETQNAEMAVYFPELSPEQSSASSFDPAEKWNNRIVGSATVQRPLGRYEDPTVTRAELKRRNHSDMPVKTRLAARKRMTLNPGAGNEYRAVNSPPLADPSLLFLTSPYPITVATHGSLGWALATLVIIVFLAAMLMVGIAISV
jgi:hypothetical protein